MEGLEAFVEGEWESLSKLFSFEDSDLLLHSNLFDFCCAAENDSSLSQNNCLYSVSQESSTFDNSSTDLMEEMQLKRKFVDDNNNSSKLKKAKKATINSNEEMDTNIVQSSSSEAKAKAAKSRATDPQSVYARKRRERINERLRILQNLVPNGTKVDISTMLEEAVQYVKFLQLQIKLLSSEDMWMYAPIAYNGVDIGLHPNIVPNL